MIVRTGEAHWEGNFKQGKGTMRVGSGLFEGPYSVSSRFEQGPGTNPDELIAAAHAGCFSMALSLVLGKANYKVDRIHTTARVTVDKVGEGFKITAIELETEGSVPGIDARTFQEKAEEAKKGCPVSVALASVPITLKARLVKLAA
jgi:osmotically inducible protein OsmC